MRTSLIARTAFFLLSATLAAIGLFISSITDSQMIAAGVSFGVVLICMLLGTALGYWAGQMLLQKSLRVLSKGNWIRCGAALLVVAAGMLCCRYDITGFSTAPRT